MLDEASFLTGHQLHARSLRFIYHYQSGTLDGSRLHMHSARDIHGLPIVDLYDLV